MHVFFTLHCYGNDARLCCVMLYLALLCFAMVCFGMLWCAMVVRYGMCCMLWYVCMYVCMHSCVPVYMYACVRASMYVYVRSDVGTWKRRDFRGSGNRVIPKLGLPRLGFKMT